MDYKVGDKVYTNFAYEIKSGVIVGVKFDKFFKWFINVEYLVKFDDYNHVAVRKNSEIWLINA